MQTEQKKISWVAFGMFYLVLIIIVSILDAANGVLRWTYWGTQVGLITLGVAILIGIGMRNPDLQASRGVLLAFTVGILTIIPAVMMGLGSIPELWSQYFYIAFGMAAGSFLTFVFLKFFDGVSKKKQLEQRQEEFD